MVSDTTDQVSVCKDFRGFSLRKIPPIRKDVLRRQLPPLGAVLNKPLYDGRENITNIKKCRVIGVNYDRLWYRVEFEETGTKECYKVPERGIANE